MLDENLPTFYLKPSKDVKHDATIHISQYGSEATPAYTLRHPEPASSASKNRYAAALYDIYNTEILYGEILLIPEWTQPTLSQDEIKNNGGVPPPPQPILPTEFTIQLYNPDQQVTVRQHSSTWNSVQHWDFEMPQQTFRQPSASTLDRTQSDPTASEITPKVEFKWKRDGKLSKDLICNLSGKTKNPDGSKRKHKEPDIPMAFFRHLRELTIYEPNLTRVDMEDPKGFEVVLLLAAATIKDVYFSQLRETFNISDPPRARQNSANSRIPSSLQTPLPSQQIPYRQGQQRPPLPASLQSSPAAPYARPNLSLQIHKSSSARPPPTDPRSQWEIDSETARLKKQVEAEERERLRKEKEETRRRRKIEEEDEKLARRQQAELDKEADKRRRQSDKRHTSGGGAGAPSMPPRHPAPTPHGQQHGYPTHAPRPVGGGTYLQAAGHAVVSSSGFLAGSAEQLVGKRVKPKRSSFFGLRGGGEEDDRRLMKKSSAIF